MHLTEMRKIRILQAIVRDYVATTRPVGSERLIEVYRIGCKSATVRNEMAEMAEMGYLEQPHTSAGRIPTERGYRFYVNELMDPPSALPENEAQQAQQTLPQEPSEVEDLLLQTCRILSGLTACPSLATDPATEGTLLRRVFLSEASPRCALLVVLLSNGHVENRLLELPSVPDDMTLLRLANYINSLVGDCELDEVSGRLNASLLPSELQPHAGTLAKIFPALTQMMSSLSERRIFLEGTSHLLRQPEFQDVQRLESLLAALEQRTLLFQMLQRAMPRFELTITIGSENSVEMMQECSVISTAYFIGDRPAGYLGVVGPTRMNYDRGVAAVGMMAQHLSLMLTNLSLA